MEWNKEAGKGSYGKEAALHLVRSQIRSRHDAVPQRCAGVLRRQGVDGKNVLDLMTLAPPERSTVRVRADGPDAAEAMHTLDQLMRSQPDED